MKKLICALIFYVSLLNGSTEETKRSSTMFLMDDSSRQRELDKLVHEQNIGYREAKNIYYQKLRAEQERARRIKEIETQQKKMKFYFDNPAFEFNEIVMQWRYDGWQPLEMIDDFSGTEIESKSYAAIYLPFVMEEVNTALSQAWERSTDIFKFKVVKSATRKSHSFEVETLGRMPIIEGAGLVALRIKMDDESIDANNIIIAKFNSDLTLFSGRYAHDADIHSLFSKGNVIKATVLTSLISYQRMYVACISEYDAFRFNVLNFRADALDTIKGPSAGIIDGLNLCQSDFVHRYFESTESVNSGMYLLQGPPGTGKTTTLRQILAQLYLKGLKTLASAPSNKAVQTMARAFLEKAHNTTNVLLIGSASKVSQDLHSIFLDYLVEQEIISAKQKLQLVLEIKELIYHFEAEMNDYLNRLNNQHIKKKRFFSIPDDLKTKIQTLLTLQDGTDVLRKLDEHVREVNAARKNRILIQEIKIETEYLIKIIHNNLMKLQRDEIVEVEPLIIPKKLITKIEDLLPTQLVAEALYNLNKEIKDIETAALKARQNSLLVKRIKKITFCLVTEINQYIEKLKSGDETKLQIFDVPQELKDDIHSLLPHLSYDILYKVDREIRALNTTIENFLLEKEITLLLEEITTDVLRHGKTRRDYFLNILKELKVRLVKLFPLTHKTLTAKVDEMQKIPHLSNSAKFLEWEKQTRPIFEPLFAIFTGNWTFLASDYKDLHQSIVKSLPSLCLSEMRLLAIEQAIPTIVWPEGRLQSLEKSIPSIISHVNLEYVKNALPDVKIPTYDDVTARLISEAKLIFCTLVSSGKQCLMDNLDAIEHLIVDEAAQSHVAEFLIPLHIEPRYCLLVGDPKQLPATTLSKKNKKASSLMHKIMNNQRNPFFMLTEQYRMHPEIRQWPSAMYYENKLTDGENIALRTTSIPISVRDWCMPLAFYDLPQARENRYKTSFVNDVEARLIKKMVDKLIEEKVAPSSIGVITFYSGQVETLERLLGTGNNSPKVSTVDGFQGSEKDIIIISFVRANRQAHTGFLKDFRRLNVAITRAKHSLLMVGNSYTLENSDSYDLKGLINDIKTRQFLFDSQALERNFLKIRPLKMQEFQR
jgi:superfamily I DNA and/or RNA helicase